MISAKAPIVTTGIMEARASLMTFIAAVLSTFFRMSATIFCIFIIYYYLI